MFAALIPKSRTATRRMVIYWAGVSLVFLGSLWFSFHEGWKAGNENSAKPAMSGAQAQIVASFGKLPLSFEANQGQADGRVKFLSHGHRYALFLTGDETVLELQDSGFGIQDSGTRAKYSMQRTMDIGPRTTFRSENRKPKIESEVICLRLAGAKPDAEVTGREELPGKANYFIGNDPKKWRTNVPTYARVRYRDVYPGVDLEYYGNQGGELEYDFIVAPGADPRAITLAVGAVRKPPLRIDASGDLLIPARGGEVRFHKPVIYQPDSGLSLVTRHPSLVDGHFRLDSQNRIRFALGPYDHSKPLVIDPELVYSTYLGGEPGYPHPGFDTANGIAVDTSGSAYVVGTAYSNYIPTTVNAFQPGNASQVSNVFITKFNATGTTLVYSTYLGGSGQPSTYLGDKGNAIAVDSAGSAYLTGQTCSSNFPTVLPLQASLQGDCDPFVTKLSPDGASLVYSTYLGGGGSADVGTGIAVDSAGNAYLTGVTDGGFPTFNPLQQSLSGLQNAFVTKLNAAGSAFVYSTYLGSYIDQGAGIAVDSSGSAYVIGTTNSTGFPTVNPFQPRLNGFQNAFVSKLNAAGSALVYSTYLGGSNSDQGTGIAVDSSGNAYLTGATSSPNFPTVNPIQTYQSTAGADNAFVTKVNPAGSALIYSTYLGGSGCSESSSNYCSGLQYGDEALGIAVDSTGVAYVAGITESADFPTVNAIQASKVDIQPQISTGFVACLNTTGSALAYSTYLGGTYGGQANAIAVDSSGNAHVDGWSPPGFPTVNPVQSSPVGNGSAAFVAMISPPPAVALFPDSLNFGNVLGGTTSPQQSVTLAPLSNASVSLSSIAASGDFALVTTATSCPYSGGTLAAGATCTIDVTFTPTATGTRSGTVTNTYTGQGSPETIALSGVGMVATANVSPASLTFGNEYVGTAGSPQSVTLTNPATVPLTVSTVTISSGWTQSDNCMPTVPANSSCTINVSFDPTVSGPQTGTLTVTDYANNSPQTVTLSGTALEPVVGLSTTSLNFAAQTVSTQSAPQTITLTNSGNGALTPLKITRTGPFAQTNTCGDSVAVGASCTISVTFSPLGAGTQNGTMTLTDNAADSPQTVELSGTGMDFAVSSTGLSQTVSPGQVANYSLTVAPQNGFSQTVNLTCTGAPALSTCTLTPDKVNPSGATAATVAVAVSTTAPSTAWLAPPAGSSLPPSFSGFGRVFWLYGLLGLASLAVLATARKRRAAYLLGACLLLTMLWTACGGGGSSTPAPKTIPGTPAGTYTVAVTGTAASTSTLTHTIQFTLTVN